MTEKLKGTVTYSRTINTGNYNSLRVEFRQEFYLDECPALQAFKDTQVKLDEMIKEATQYE